MITSALTFCAINFNPLVFLGEEPLIPPHRGSEPSQVVPYEGLAPDHHGGLAVDDEGHPPPAGQAQSPQ